MSKTLYVGNLSYEATEADLIGHFHPHAITEVRIVRDRETGKAKGFAFVEFASEQGAHAGLEFEGTQLLGRGLRVSVAREQRGGGGGRRGGGDRDERARRRKENEDYAKGWK